MQTGTFQFRRKVDGRLSAELDNDAVRLLLVGDVQHIFHRQRLEVETVGDVKVRADRLRIVVDDDGFDAHFAQRPYRMHRAIVKLHALTDADRPRAEHNHLFLVRYSDLVLRPAEGGIVVRRHRLELSGTGIHHLIARQNIVAVAHRADLIARLLRDLGDGNIGETDPLGSGEKLRCERLLRKLTLNIGDMLQLMDEPLVHLRDARDVVYGQLAAAQHLRHDEDALIVDEGKLLFQTFIIPVGKAFQIETVHTDLEGTCRLEDGTFKAAVNGHDLARRLHLRAERMIRVDEFVERPARELHHAVVNGRLKAGLCLLRDRVDDLIQRIADGDFRRHLGNRVARCLRRERRGTADARIHLDNVVLIALRIERVLRVAAALNAELADDPQTCAAQHLILVIGQRLCGRNNDTVSRMNTNRVKILHTADGNAVIVSVTNDLELDLLPSRDTALDEHLPDHGVVQALNNDGNEVFLVLRNAAARTPHGIGRADDDRVADRVGKVHSSVDILDNQALRDRLTELLHRLLKALAILRLLDGIERRTEELHTVLRQDPLLCKLNGKVQSRLSAERGEKAIRLLLGNNLRQEFHRQRLDVNTVGDIGVCHDGSRVAVDEDDLQPVFLQCTAGL